MFRLISLARRHRYLIAHFVVRDLKIKYRDTVFGYLWSLLEPFSIVGIYYFVFVTIAQRGGSDFPLLVILGLLPWNYLSGVILGCAHALRANAELVLRAQIPREVYILATTASNLVVLVLAMLSVVPLMFIFHVTPGVSILLWPVAILALSAFATGIGLIVSAANVIWRDVGYLLGVILRIALYFSAAVFPVELVPERIRYLFCFNPVTVYLTVARQSFVNRPLGLEPEHLIVAGLAAAASLLLGALVFPKLEQQAVKLL
ncbi:MAG: ABC transporter permease [Deltaproteobacteria bacterium]|nr:ABC transporter permease [Deltaproteobacteria bacterium]